MVKTPLGVESETTLIVNPVVTSEITGFSEGGKVAAGTKVSDEVFLDGVDTRVVPDSAAALTAVASGVLAGPIAPNSKGTCEGLDWSKAKVIDAYADVEVDGSNKLGGLFDKQLNEAGCYSASAEIVISHDGKVVATGSHDLGVASQTVLVVPTPETPTPTIETGDVPTITTGSFLPAVGLGVAALAALTIGAVALGKRQKG